MASISSGTGFRGSVYRGARQAHTTIQKSGGASTDGFDGVGQASVYRYQSPFDPADSVQIGTAEGILDGGLVGGRVSLFDAQKTFTSDNHVAVSGSGPSAQAILGFTKDSNGTRIGLGGALSAGGVAASGRLGSRKNNVSASVGVGLGIGAGIDVNSKRNPDGSTTTSINVGARVLGRFNVGVTQTSNPAAYKKSRLKGPGVGFRHKNPKPVQSGQGSGPAAGFAKRDQSTKISEKPNTASTASATGPASKSNKPEASGGERSTKSES